MAKLTAALLFLLYCLAPARVGAEELESQLSPKICTGFDASRNHWGVPPMDDAGRRICADNYAIFAAGRSWTKSRRGEEIPLLAVCCPLPGKGILTDRHAWVNTECPEQSVVTGYEVGSVKSDLRFTAMVRCTEIDLKKYRLASATTGAFWGIGSSAAMPWNENARLLRAAIPPAIRYGIERLERQSRTSSGCIGQPIGSLLVGKRGRHCKDMIFRELQFSAPPSGKMEQARLGIHEPVPVAMFPRCRQISDVFSQTPECLDSREE